MYDLLDRPVAELASADRILLDRTRAWVHVLTMTGGYTHDIADRASAGDVAFDRAMRRLDQGSTETLTFQRPCHPIVEDTEAMVLALWRMIAADRLADAVVAARGLVAPAAARSLVGAMVRADAGAADN